MSKNTMLLVALVGMLMFFGMRGAAAISPSAVPTHEQDTCRASKLKRDNADSKWEIVSCRLHCSDPKASCEQRKVTIAGDHYWACSCDGDVEDEPSNPCCQLVVGWSGGEAETFGDCLSCPASGQCHYEIFGEEDEEQEAIAYCGSGQVGQ